MNYLRLLPWCFLLIFVASGCGDKHDQNAEDAEDTSSSLSKSQMTIHDTIADYSADPAIININGYLLPSSLKAGEIKASGEFQISFPKDFSTRTDSLMNAFNQTSQSYQMSRQSVAQYFINQGSDSLKTGNTDAKISLAGGSYGFQLIGKQGDTLGSIYPMSSRQYLYNLFTEDIENLVPGYHLAFMHVDTTASVAGSYSQLNYTEKDSYDIDMKYDVELTEGWNIVKHIMDTVQLDKKAYPKRFMTKTIDSIPTDLEWIFVAKRP